MITQTTPPASSANRSKLRASNTSMKRLSKVAAVDNPTEGADDDKTIGWHSFRHALATNLRSMGVDVKVAQELLRHANSRITLDLYTRAVSADKRNSNNCNYLQRITEVELPQPAPV